MNNVTKFTVALRRSTFALIVTALASVIGVVAVPARATVHGAASGPIPHLQAGQSVHDIAVHYNSFGWSYQEVTPGGDSGFQRLDYNASGWPSGQAPFGTADDSCWWNSQTFVNTAWESGNDILLRRDFDIPANATSVRISGTVYSSAAVYVNGNQIGKVGSTECASGEINLSVPRSDIGSSNLLAIRAKGTGVANFLDLQVTYDGPKPSQYIALGDSFSSGEGNPPYDKPTDRSTNKCHRSPKAYPRILRSRSMQVWNLGSDDFVACSGSEIQDIVYGQTSKTHREGTQLNKLNFLTSKVTITVGGNNVDFLSVLEDCIYGIKLAGVDGSRNCADHVFTGGNSTHGMTLNNYEQALIAKLADDLPCVAPKGDFPPKCWGLVPSLTHLYELVQSEAPNAAIYVLLYPHLFNDRPGPAPCDLYGTAGVHALISQQNQKFIDQGIDLVDNEIVAQVQHAQAAGTNVHYVDPRSYYDNTTNGQGHGVCSKHPWINGVHVEATVPPEPAPESFHPNATGQAAFADAVQAVSVRMPTAIALEAPTQPSGNGTDLTAVDCPALSVCVAAGGDRQGVLLETKTGSTWEPARVPLPVQAGTSGSAFIDSIACPSASWCAAVGSYFNPTTETRGGILVSGFGSKWTESQFPPGSLPGFSYDALNSVACSSKNSCVAVGAVTDETDTTHGLIVTGSGTSWQWRKAPLPAGVPSGNFAFLQSVACPSTGSCTAVGTYQPSDSSMQEDPLILTGSGSNWTAGSTLIPPNSGLLVDSVTCPSASSCTAAASYQDLVTDEDSGLILTNSTGSWTATDSPFPSANLAAIDAPYSEDRIFLTCPSVSVCVGAGTYEGYTFASQALLMAGSGTSWMATKAPLPAGISAYVRNELRAVACPAQNSCIAIGDYDDDAISPTQLPILVTGVGTSWAASAAPLPPDALSATPIVAAELDAVSCPSLSSCTAVGGYLDSSDKDQGLIETISP